MLCIAMTNVQINKTNGCGVRNSGEEFGVEKERYMFSIVRGLVCRKPLTRARAHNCGTSKQTVPVAHFLKPSSLAEYASTNIQIQMIFLTQKKTTSCSFTLSHHYSFPITHALYHHNITNMLDFTPIVNMPFTCHC